MTWRVVAAWFRGGTFQPFDDLTFATREAAEQHARVTARRHPAWTVDVEEVQP